MQGQFQIRTEGSSRRIQSHTYVHARCNVTQQQQQQRPPPQQKVPQQLHLLLQPAQEWQQILICQVQ